MNSNLLFSSCLFFSCMKVNTHSHKYLQPLCFQKSEIWNQNHICNYSALQTLSIKRMIPASHLCMTGGNMITLNLSMQICTKTTVI
jgi:hypothetical protein